MRSLDAVERTYPVLEERGRAGQAAVRDQPIGQAFSPARRTVGSEPREGVRRVQDGRRPPVTSAPLAVDHTDDSVVLNTGHNGE